MYTKVEITKRTCQRTGVSAITGTVILFTLLFLSGCAGSGCPRFVISQPRDAAITSPHDIWVVYEPCGPLVATAPIYDRSTFRAWLDGVEIDLTETGDYWQTSDFSFSVGDHVLKVELSTTDSTQILSDEHSFTVLPHLEAAGSSFPISELNGLNEHPAIAMNPTGDFLVVWQAEVDTDSNIFMRRFAADGTPLDSDAVLVNTKRDRAQLNPDVAMDAEGNFVVVWESEHPHLNGKPTAIFGRRYSTSGQPLTDTEFQVNTVVKVSQPQEEPAIAMNADGSFIIVWQGRTPDQFDIVARRYHPDGTPQNETEFKVNAFLSGNQWNPDIALNNQGSFVIAWYGRGPDSMDPGTYVRRYDSSGVPQGEEERANSTTSGWSGVIAPTTIGMDETGGVIVAWGDYTGLESSGVYARRYDSNGNPLSKEEFLVSADGIQPAIAMMRDGEIIITWTIRDQIGIRKYEADGTARELIETSVTSGDGLYPDVAVNNAGNIVVAWVDAQTNEGGSAVNGDIYARRFIGH